MPMNDDRTLSLVQSGMPLPITPERSSLPCLILYSGADAGRRFDLPPGRHLIGRTEGAAIRLDLPDVSRRHAELDVQGDRVTVQDLGSANRTCVNGTPIQQPMRLCQGDVLQVAHLVLRFHDCTSLDALLHDRIYRLATTDPGTGAFNRRYLQDILGREVQRARRGGHPLSVICFDLDHFKRVNDTHGHAAGDRVLQQCVQRVQACLRAGDVLCRVGGEEFTVLLPDTALEAAVVLAERLRLAVSSAPIVWSAGSAAEPAAGSSDGPQTLPGPDGSQDADGPGLQQTISLGVADLAPEVADGTALLAWADHRLYAAKRGGRNCVVADDQA